MTKKLLKLEIIFNWFKKKKIKINSKTNLFKSGDLDSFGFIEFLIFLQNKFKIKLEHEKIFNKKSININDFLKILDAHENRKIKKK